MYNYKSRCDVVKKAWTEGFEESQKFKLGEDYHNWSPLMVYCYHVGVITGLFCGIFSCIIIYLAYTFL